MIKDIMNTKNLLIPWYDSCTITKSRAPENAAMVSVLRTHMKKSVITPPILIMSDTAVSPYPKKFLFMANKANIFPVVTPLVDNLS